MTSRETTDAADRGQAALVVVPARGGSQGVPLKNLQRVGGRSLVARAVATALAAGADVVVSTDHDGIADEARAAGATVVRRPDELSGPTASSESAVLDVLDVLAQDGRRPAVTVLLQCTSPFVDPDDLAAAIGRVASGEADVAFAVAPTHDFQWTLDGGEAAPVGHSALHRPRRQERAPHFRETGAFYVMRTAGLRETGRRFFGRLALQVVDPDGSLEIDEPADLELARLLAGRRDPRAVPLDVDALVTDFDGVHTDDHAWVDEDGHETVRVHRGDGWGMARLRERGVPVLVLSTERNPVVRARAAKLGVDVRHGVDDKVAALEQWLDARGLDRARVAYVGNDVNDLAAMARVGWPVAVADAHPDVRAAARLVLTRRGGDGAVREICDLLATRGRSSVEDAPTSASHVTTSTP